MKCLAVYILFLFLCIPLFGQGLKPLHSEKLQENILTKPIEDSAYTLKIELGIRDEFMDMFTRLYDGNSGTKIYEQSMFLPINFHLTLGIRLFEKYKLDYRMGLMYFYEDFYGIDKGFFLQADLFKSIYGTVGIDFINNSGDSHGVTMYSESGGNTTFYCFGMGCNLSKHFNLDFMYYYPKDKVFGYDVDNINHIRYDKINNGSIVIGIQYSLLFKIPNDKP